MTRLKALAISATGLLVLLAVSLWNSPASAELPPGYTLVPGTIPLNPAHVGAVGSQFTQVCTGLPRPPGPGEVAWHFILPQATQFDPTPTNGVQLLVGHGPVGGNSEPECTQRLRSALQRPRVRVHVDGRHPAGGLGDDRT